MSATAAISVMDYSGGLPEATPSGILTFLFFTAAIVGGVAMFSFFGEVHRRAQRRAHARLVNQAPGHHAGERRPARPASGPGA